MIFRFSSSVTQKGRDGEQVVNYLLSEFGIWWSSGLFSLPIKRSFFLEDIELMRFDILILMSVQSYHTMLRLMIMLAYKAEIYTAYIGNENRPEKQGPSAGDQPMNSINISRCGITKLQLQDAFP